MYPLYCLFCPIRQPYMLIALENKLIGTRSLIRHVNAHTGVHRVPVATGLLRFGERAAIEPDGG